MKIKHREILLQFSLTDARLGKQQFQPNLAPLLYLGGSAIDVRYISKKILDNELGQPIIERLELVGRLHKELKSMIVEGVSSLTIRARIGKLKVFFAWCDLAGQSISMATAEDCIINWSKALRNRVRLKEILNRTARGMLSTIIPLFEEVLDLNTPIHSKLFIKSDRKSPRSSFSNNLNIQKAFEFGHFLHDITQSLSLDRVYGNLPVIVELRDGRSFEEWSGLLPENQVKALTYKQSAPAKYRATYNTRAAWIAEHTPRTRRPLINLRLEAELLIFIAETALPLKSAYSLTYGSFSYKSITGGYELRKIYKDRAKGVLVGNIHKEYRAHFDEYLIWRNSIFDTTDDCLLFPFITAEGKSEDLAPLFHALKKRTNTLNIDMLGARKLKKLKLNFLLRETKNPEITAEYGQHSIKTFFENYNQPSPQAAFVEISNFHKAHDPFLIPPGPGICLKAKPERILINPSHSDYIPMSDCMSPSGCLFCSQNRDLEDFDHIWSLLSFRQLKIIEHSRGAPVTDQSSPNPSLAVIRRITEKLETIEENSLAAHSWISEARFRIEEGDYHPKWRGFIKLTEFSSMR